MMRELSFSRNNLETLEAFDEDSIKSAFYSESTEQHHILPCIICKTYL